MPQRREWNGTSRACGTVVNRNAVAAIGRPHVSGCVEQFSMIGMASGEKVILDSPRKRSSAPSRLFCVGGGISLGQRRKRAWDSAWCDENWRDREDRDVVGGVPWNTSPSEDGRRRSCHMRVKDIVRQSASVNCGACVVALRGQRGLTRTFPTRLNNEISERSRG